MNGVALFTGVGGLDLGIQLVIPSSRSVCYVEREAFAAAVLRAKMEEGRLHKAPIWSDVTTFDGRPFVEKVDYISAGFPCQPWSVAGSKKGTEDERWLWEDIKRIICEIRPSFIFLENVPGITMGGLDPILRDLASIGFNAEWGMLKASEVGARHHRKRFFLFGYRANSDDRLRSKPVEEILTRRDFIGTSCYEFSNSNISGIKKCTLSDFKWEEIPNVNGNNSELIGQSEQNLANPRRKPRKIQASRKHTSVEVPECHSWWQVEPSVGRVVDGMAHRVDRLRACGNGVVPLQAAVAYSILIERAIQRGGLIGA